MAERVWDSLPADPQSAFPLPSRNAGGHPELAVHGSVSASPLTAGGRDTEPVAPRVYAGRIRAVPSETGDVTRLLGRWQEGEPEALGSLVELVYGELKAVARGLLRDERAEHTLQPTALVHEAYLRLEGVREVRFENRRHFYGAAARCMRRILVDYARRRKAGKRGGEHAHRVDLDEVSAGAIDLRLDFERLDVALDALAAIASSQAQVVDLRYFAGLSIEETAGTLDLSPATVKRHWTFARAWLLRELSAPDAS
jgi:RNA polymerase sigma factor (TIGR02999 family)